MKIKVIFFNSGDEIIFDTINPEVSEYYIEHLNKKNVNLFTINHNCVNYYDQLKSQIKEINSFISEFINFQFDAESLDQRKLNKLHCDWAKVQQILIDVRKIDNVELKEKLFHFLPDDGMIISIAYALKLINKSDTYNNLNLLIHSLERSFSGIRASTDNWYQIENPYSQSCLSFTPTQLFLPYNHLGRSLYSKFLFRDNNLEFDDENAFTELLGYIEINLGRQQFFDYSNEYKIWCQQNNREPTGVLINFGKLKDLEERLTYYRQIIFNNVKMQNSFFIEQGQ